jgi:hypothetical protein
MQIWTWNAFGHGTFDLAFPFGTAVVNRHSKVVTSVCEVAAPPGGPLDFPFIGSASIQTLNVAPEDDGAVHVRLAVNWSSNLNFRLTFFIS